MRSRRFGQITHAGRLLRFEVAHVGGRFFAAPIDASDAAWAQLTLADLAEVMRRIAAGRPAGVAVCPSCRGTSQRADGLTELDEWGREVVALCPDCDWGYVGLWEAAQPATSTTSARYLRAA